MIKKINAKLLSWLACGIFALSMSCQQNIDQSRVQGTEDAKGRPVYLQCDAPKGNGGNWASSLGWISEQWLLKAEVAEHAGGLLYLHCMGGGSSGSATALVVMNLLRNENLFASKAKIPSLLTPLEAKMAASALRFVAMSTDLNLRERANFFLGLLHNKITEQVFPKSNPEWWKKQQTKPDDVLVDFGSVLVLARYLTKEMVTLPVEKALGSNASLISLAKKHNVKTVIDFPRVAQAVSVDEPSYRPLEELVTKQVTFVGKLSDDFLVEYFKSKNLTYQNRFSEQLKKLPENPINKLLAEELAPGFYTFTMAALLKDKSEMSWSVGPEYSKQKAIIFCSEETAKLILNSSWYQKHIQQGHKFASRYAFAVTDVRGALVPSIREPEMMEELHGDLKNQGIKKLYVPEFDLEKNGKYTFELHEINAEVNPYYTVAGGFPDRRIAGWVQPYLANEIAKTRLKGMNVRGELGLFGLPDNRSKDNFQTVAIRNFFSGPVPAKGDIQATEKWRAKGQAQVQDFIAWQEALFPTFEPEFASSSAQWSFKTVALNWDVTKLPAFLTGSAKTLVARAINSVREQYEPSPLGGAPSHSVFEALPKQ
jgi:hypothetical protein